MNVIKNTSKVLKPFKSSVRLTDCLCRFILICSSVYIVSDSINTSPKKSYLYLNLSIKISLFLPLSVDGCLLNDSFFTYQVRDDYLIIPHPLCGHPIRSFTSIQSTYKLNFSLFFYLSKYFNRKYLVYYFTIQAIINHEM